ncbi:penicillin-binding protein 1C [Succinivibrio dextrinosolvens DSM 3072]|uniref:peptidoglycan glycosyltransferase n=1 Tax=Succinivibrio dextrinosolvens DSM 3072 TaxID=1123324 RepID=A0A1T4V6K0_9GAMM|nr:transglycosylase domain-containing protein [Succinivibrio dextrinosolvens]SKA60598.1 penicillin-binding protein 1C [Succinivibrio dextrinosolvens DSM 3072]
MLLKISMHLTKIREFFYVKRLCLTVLLLITAVTAFVIFSITSIDLSPIENRSKVLFDKDGNVIAYSLSSDSQIFRFLTTPEDVSDIYLKMLLSNEDKNFYSHIGVDFKSLARALVYNLKNQEITSGGSTIAMQVVKRLSHHKKRTYINKLKEIVGAVYITARFGREKVLTWYLTLAPYGSNIEGVKAASLKWFNHLPDRLTPSESALMVALPRAPELIRPDLHPKRARYYKNEAIKLAYKNEIINEDLMRIALAEDCSYKLHNLKQSAYTLGNYTFTRAESTKTDNNNSSKEFYTNIDSKIQHVLNEAAEKYEISKRDNAILSTVVLDCKTHQIVALNGSSDTNNNQICLPYRLRSPGSTLKPFAYAMAFESGKLHPQTIMKDTGRLYGSWKPDNFNYKFNGEIKAKDALCMSLNIPALEVIKAVGPDDFYKRLNKRKRILFITDGMPDSSIILGSGSISLVDLTSLYAMLNTDGKFYPYDLFRKASDNTENDNQITQASSFRLLSKESARAVFEILKNTARPDNHPDNRTISYKTGTSYKFKDALAIGSNGKYTVGVAITHPDNRTTNYNNTGYTDAAPVLFDILLQLKDESLDKEDIDDVLFSNTAPKALQKQNIKQEILGQKDKLKITFPLNNSVVAPDYKGRIYIRHEGGSGKVFLNTDDSQLESDYIEVSQNGFYKVCIFDGKAQSDCVDFEVKLK